MILNYAIFLLVYIVLSMLVAVLGRRRKWGYWGYLWASIIFTPFFGALFVLSADPRPRRKSPAKARAA
jgi:Na+/melibiose symporter-like transporter